MVVHFLMAGGRYQTIGVLLLKDPIHALSNGVAVFALAGNMAGRKKGHDGQARDGRAALIIFSDPGAVALLRALEILQSPLDGLIHGLAIFEFCGAHAGNKTDTDDE